MIHAYRLLTVALMIWCCVPVCAQEGSLKLVVFSKTAGYRHGSIDDGIRMFERIAVDSSYTVTFTEDASIFSDASLADVNVVVFLSTTGNVLDGEQQSAFERFVQRGGGFVGIHAASDTEYDWPWYGGLVGAYFSNHPAVQSAEILIEDRTHSSTNFLPRRWQMTDEWYDYRSNPRGGVHVLASLNERSYDGGSMGYDHPIAWCHDYDGGRAWYTGMGHTSEVYRNEEFRRHVLGGILWASGLDASVANASVAATYERRTLLDELDQPMQLCSLGEQRFLIMERSGKILLFDEKTGAKSIAANYNLLRDGEYGALGMALAHDFNTSKALYILLADVQRAQFRLLRTLFTGTALDTNGQQTILEFPFDPDECCHAAGDLAVTPNGDVYLSVGDNSNPFDKNGYAPLDERPGEHLHDAQRTSGNTNDLRGKILRIRPNASGGYDIPPDNLFPTGAAKTRPEIYAMGARNPFRISFDSTTGHLWWGDVGPDATDPSPSRGPIGYDEVNRSTRAANFGWPYAIGPNLSYVVRGELADTAAPSNLSPNNSGLAILPPCERATVWYPYATDGGSDNVGTGGRSACVGPVVRLPESDRSPYALNAYFEGTVLMYDFIRCWLRAIHLDESGKVLKIVPIMNEMDSLGLIDLCMTPDGVLYGLGWRDKGGKVVDGKLFKILALNRSVGPPQARIRVNRWNGATPLVINFDASSSLGSVVRYEWDVNGDSIPESTDAMYVHTFAFNGTFTVTLRVFDNSSTMSVATREIVAGNSPPVITIERPYNGQVADISRPLYFRVRVTDAEDPSVTGDAIVSQLALGHDDHAHPLLTTRGYEGKLVATDDLGHGNEADIFGVYTVRVDDRAIGGARSLSTTASAILQPVRKRAQHTNFSSGIDLEDCLDEGGGKNIAFIDHNDAFSISPLDLRDIDSIRIRYASGNGGILEVRANSVSGNVIAAAQLSNTGGYQNWITQSTAIRVSEPFTTYFFVAKNEGAAGLFNVNWIEFVQKPTGVPVKGSDNDDVSILANPVDKTAEIEVRQSTGPISATLSDLRGVTVWSSTVCQDPSSCRFSIDTRPLASGIYMLCLENSYKAMQVTITVLH